MRIPDLVVLLLILASLGALAVISLTLADVLWGWGILLFYTLPALAVLAWAWRESSPATWRTTWRRVTGRGPPPAAPPPRPVPTAGAPAVLSGTIHAWLLLMRAGLAAWRSPRGRIVVNVGFGLTAVGTSVLLVRHFATVGWPLAGADLPLVGAAGGLLLGTHVLKAIGWRQLFRRHERPRSLMLATSSGAASLAGVALPGRFEDVVRVTVVRRLPGRRPGVGTIVLTLFLLGLLDAAALAPFAAATAATSDSATGVRIVLVVVASAGVGAALLFATLTRMVAGGAPAHHRLTRWLRHHAPASARDAWRAAVIVATGVLVRLLALVVLLAALGVGTSIDLAVTFLVGGAVSAVLPIGPTGAATQAGGGAAALAASGIGTDQAVAFAIVAQGLSVLAGGAIVLFAIALHLGRRLRTTPVA
ncbi:lysylphosphatidylglycerol synthase domain-containing protein [Miltoncostaea oceani]|uniref:lysylphosphatidylglycerol synthase domain-containing protein n=1 Tax=Miltoncostaea oceani TaxID=2843216 RepID=UPI001C3D97A6|nr:lysylphosphatidylglycerol synthase domain-containing protein [Miltoncostaea oceani]